MQRRHRLLLPLAGFAAATILSMGARANVPATTQPSLDELREQIRQLQDRIQQLEDQQHAPERAAVTDETVHRVLTDAHQRTSVPGVYACGDIVHASLNQITVATAHAAIAATAIHNSLL